MNVSRETWPMVRLGDLGKWTAGGTPPRKRLECFGGGIPWASIADLNDGHISKTVETLTQAGIESSSAKLYPANSLLVAMYGSIGKLAINDVPMSSSQAIACFVPDESRIMLEFAFAALQNVRPLLQNWGRGGTQKNIGQGILKSIEIPLPPIAEQRRIAEILEESAGHARLINKEIEQISELAQNSMVQRFVSQACSSQRGWKTIGDYVESTQYGTSAKANESQGIPVLRMGNVTYDGRIDYADMKFVELDPKADEKLRLVPGDLLFNRTNSAELVGKTAVFYGGPFEKTTFAGYLVRARVTDGATPEYISAFLNCRYGKAYLRKQAKAIVGMANINAKEFLRIPIPEASSVEQQEFAELAKEVMSQVQKLELKKQKLQQLHQSLATRAFAGQL